MLFNTLAYWLFFAFVLIVNYAGPARASRAFLVLASFFFYAMWNLALAPLLAVCVLFNYVSGLLIGRSTGARARGYLILAVTANLAILGFFKYYQFLLGAAAHFAPIPAFLRLDVALPIAISFYTFESIAYNVDIYRGDVKARTSLIDFALFLSFFPHLVAGPIIRPAHFFPQIVGRPAPTGDQINWGALQIFKGLVKKCVFADNFALIANPYFNAGFGHSDAVAAWVATLAFSMQIYFDFSGYTDIARGCAQLLGYQFPSNFERPYLSLDIAEFWRRWHISLSTWLRDYLYLPLGGNRKGPGRTYLNLMITMALGGLWHGANWNYMLWGVYHGLLLIVHRLWRNGRPKPAQPSVVGRAASTALTFLAVTLGWVTFRTANFADTALVYRELLTGGVHFDTPPSLGFAALIGVTMIWLWADRGRRLQSWLISGEGSLSFARASAAVAVSLLAIELFSPTGVTVPFIYFRF
jgi:alginate O-acetyltransferase complex protein AlgI